MLRIRSSVGIECLSGATIRLRRCFRMEPFEPVTDFHVVCQFQAGSLKTSQAILGNSQIAPRHLLTGVWTFGGGWYGRLGHNNMDPGVGLRL